MVAAMVDGGADNNYGEPEPSDGEMRSCNDRTSNYRTEVDDGVF